MHHREGGERQVLDPVGDGEQLAGELARLVLREAVEDVHVGPAGEDLALCAHDQRPGRVGLHGVERGQDRLRQLAAEEVQRRVVDREDAEVAVALVARALCGSRRCLRAESLVTAQLRGHLGELALLRLARHARQLERVVLPARDHVDVEVEHGLPGGGLAAVEEVHALGAELVAHAGGQPLGRGHGVLEVLVRRLVEVLGVVLRDHEGVPARPGVDVHERDRVLVLVDPLGGQLPRQDLAEDAVLVRHRPGTLPRV